MIANRQRASAKRETSRPRGEESERVQTTREILLQSKDVPSSGRIETPTVRLLY